MLDILDIFRKTNNLFMKLRSIYTAFFIQQNKEPRRNASTKKGCSAAQTVFGPGSRYKGQTSHLLEPN